MLLIVEKLESAVYLPSAQGRQRALCRQQHEVSTRISAQAVELNCIHSFLSEQIGEQSRTFHDQQLLCAAQGPKETKIKVIVETAFLLFKPMEGLQPSCHQGI